MTNVAACEQLNARTVPDRLAPHLVLWNTPAFYALRPELEPSYHRFDYVADGRLIGSIAGALDGGTFVAGASAPFAGPDFVRDNETVRAVDELIEQAVAHLRTLGVRRVEVRMKPPHSNANEPAVLFSLLTRGFTVVETNLNYFIDLSGVLSTGSYVDSLKPPARRAIRYGEQLGLRSRLLDTADDDGWREAYDVLRVNRESKGRPTRLPYEYVAAIRDAFRGLVRMVVVDDVDNVCAAALLYRVAPGRDVVQYWGDAKHSLPNSPMNFLVREVVHHALETGCRFLDLGISTDHGEPNHGLIQFKRSVGARAETRLELALDIPADR